MNIINKAAFKLLKDINGNITYTSLCNYINSKGFLLIELHTDKGDEILRRFECYEEYADKRGITVMQEFVKFVIVDSTLPASDKVRILLHEIGHINLHFENESTFDDISKMERENQVEIFAYTVLRMSKFKFLYKIRLKNVVALVLIVAALSLMWSYRMETAPAYSTNSTRSIISADTLSDSEKEDLVEKSSKMENFLVYATPKGEVFHEIDCSYVNPLTARELTVDEAEQEGLRACKRCRPTDD